MLTLRGSLQIQDAAKGTPQNLSCYYFALNVGYVYTNSCRRQKKKSLKYLRYKQESNKDFNVARNIFIEKKMSLIFD